MELKAKQFRAEDARQLLNNDAWKMMWQAMNEYLESKSLACDTAKDPQTAADIIRCKQLLSGLERELHRIIQDGQIAELQLDEMEKKKTPLQRIFAR